MSESIWLANPLKPVAVTALESALGETVAKLTGVTYTAEIHHITYEHDNMFDAFSKVTVTFKHAPASKILATTQGDEVEPS
jgi:hypothetical protein